MKTNIIESSSTGKKMGAMWHLEQLINKLGIKEKMVHDNNSPIPGDARNDMTRQALGFIERMEMKCE